MSIPFLDRIFDNWKNPEYEGFMEMLPHSPSKISTFDSELVEKLKIDIEQIQYLQPNIKPLDEYEKTKKGLLKFLSDRNFKFAHPRDPIKVYKMRGVGYEDNDYIKRYLNTDMKYILQVSFGNGTVTMDMLENTNAYIVTYSLYKYEYSWYAKMFIDYNFPNRHNFLIGMSQTKSMWYNIPKIKFDMIYYDGSRNYSDVYETIKDCKEYSDRNTIILLSSVVPHQGWGHGPYVAMLKLIKDDIVTFIEHIKIPGLYGDYTSGLAVLKYNFDIQTPNILPYKDIEINIPLYEFSHYIKEPGTLSKDTVEYYVKKLIEEGITIDDYLRKDLKDKYNINID